MPGVSPPSTCLHSRAVPMDPSLALGCPRCVQQPPVQGRTPGHSHCTPGVPCPQSPSMEGMEPRWIPAAVLQETILATGIGAVVFCRCFSHLQSQREGDGAPYPPQALLRLPMWEPGMRRSPTEGSGSSPAAFGAGWMGSAVAAAAPCRDLPGRPVPGLNQPVPAGRQPARPRSAQHHPASCLRDPEPSVGPSGGNAPIGGGTGVAGHLSPTRAEIPILSFRIGSGLFSWPTSYLGSSSSH